MVANEYIQGDAGASETSDDVLRRTISRIATEKFLDGGYSSTTSDEIARSCGISKKTLYRLYPTKEELLRGVIRQLMHEIEVTTDPLFEAHNMPFQERIERFVAAISIQYARLRSPKVVRELQRSAPSVWKEFDDWRRWRFSLFREMMVEGLTQHDIRPELSVDDLLSIYSVMINHCMDHHVVDGQTIQPERIYRAFMNAFFSGVMESWTVSPAETLPDGQSASSNEQRRI